MLSIRSRPRAGILGLARPVAGAIVAAAVLAACTGPGAPTAREGHVSDPTAPGSVDPSRSHGITFLVSDSSWSFESTLGTLRRNLAAAGLAVRGNLNQGAGLKATGLTLFGPPTAFWGAHTLFVSDPAAETDLLAAHPATGTLTPTQIYVWTDDTGHARIGYLDPASLAQAIAPRLRAHARQIADDLEQVVARTAGRPHTYGSTPAARFVSQPSAHTVEMSIARLHEAAAGAGMSVLAEIDPPTNGTTNAAPSGSAVTLFIGDLDAAKPLFDLDPAVGTVLPTRIHLWAGRTGLAHIGYFDPVHLLAVIDPQLKNAGTRLSATIRDITAAAAAPAQTTVRSSQAITPDPATS